MKIRSSFVSNSSSSSFIINKKFIKEEIKQFVKAQLIKKTLERISEVEKEKETYCDNWEEYIEFLKKDISDENIDYNINITTVQEYLDNGWDLSEWYDLDKLDLSDWILHDIDDNFINWCSDEIISNFNVDAYCLHMG